LTSHKLIIKQSFEDYLRIINLSSYFVKIGNLKII